MQFPTGMYHSEGATPSLADCLKATQWRIQRLYNSRAKALAHGLAFVDFWNGICDWLGKERTATYFADHLELAVLPRPNALDALSIATAYWVEASTAHDRLHDDERSWAALVRCHYYFGMADGPETNAERGSRGGRAQVELYKELKPYLLGWLAELPENGYSSLVEVFKAVQPQVKAFTFRQSDTPNAGTGAEKSGVRRVANPKALLQAWSVDDAEVRQAMSRLVAGGIKKGRKPAKARSPS